MRRRLFTAGGFCALALVFAALAVCSGARAASPDTTQTPLQAEAIHFWRAAAEADVEAAYALIRDNHPGMVPELGDLAFRQSVAAAYARARAQAAAVASYEGYAATLAAFADALGDKHIWSRPNYVTGRPEWAGLLLSKRGEHWIVVDEEASPPAESVMGAELVSCDGRSPDDLARATLGTYRVDWSVGAQQVQAAPWLLVDEHNPFTPRPIACVFDKGGRRVPVALSWRAVRREALTPRIAAAAGAGSAGFGVRAVGEGYWISLQSLLDPAAPVVAEVAAKAAQLRQARFVVLDLRGNGGGSSLFGDQIAASLLGPDYVASVLGSDDDDCDEAWRVSDGNLRQLQYYVDVMGPTHGPEFTKVFGKQLADAKAARAQGRSFSGPIACANKPRAPAAARGAPAFKRKLVLITDSLCFSSCLIVTDHFRQLGALHVGQTTDADTHYSEVREELLPSGLSKFSTLQAVSVSEPLRYGPFVPALAYPGDIADTQALEQWVLKQVNSP